MPFVTPGTHGVHADLQGFKPVTRGNYRSVLHRPST